MITNLKILTSDSKQIDYENATDLGIKFNRIAVDLTAPDERIGEFSYTFSIPRTRNNEEIMQFAGINYVKNVFKINPISVRVYNNDILILVGQLELQEITNESYKCILYSKLTQLIDDLADKNMQEISVCPKIAWAYEDTIRAHIASGGTNADETDYQFPLVYYNTYFCPTSVFTGLTDTVVDSNGTTNHIFQRERSWQNWYYLINRTELDENEVYQHQVPLAFFLKPMMEYMLADVDWSMSGSFWEDENVKKIIVPYVGDTDVYDRAKYCDNGGWFSGGTCYTGNTDTPITHPPTATGNTMLDTGKFMPDMSCLDFLDSILKLFNLFIQIDINSKTIIFEPYDMMFNSKIAPFVIDNKVINTPVISKVDDYNPTIRFEELDNQRILGDNRYFVSTGTSLYDNAGDGKYLITANKTLFDKVFNHIGSTEGEISIKFGAPAVKRMRIRNDYDINDVNKHAKDTVLFLPMITKQVPEDNMGKNFSKKDTDSKVYNSEETIQYAGKPALYFYYGISTSDLQQHTALIGAQSNYYYFNFDDVNQRIPFCSPFALGNYRDTIEATLAEAFNNPSGSTDSPEVMLASYLQTNYLQLTSTSGVSNTTDFSLILSDINDFGDTIYTKFHSNMYNRYRNSEVLSLNIICTDYDWQNMQINTPIKYNNQIYSILEINNFDIVNQTAELKLIKQI